MIISFILIYLNISADPFVDPLLNLGQIGVDFDEAQFSAPFDQLIRFHHQFLRQKKVMTNNKDSQASFAARLIDICNLVATESAFIKRSNLV